MPSTPNDQSGSGWDDIIKSERHAGKRPRPKPRLRRAFTYLFLLLVIVALLAAGSLAYVQLRLKANAVDLAELDTQKASEPMNVLALGSDSRDVLPADEIDKFDPSGGDRGTGRRADTIILIHLDEQRDQAVIVSFPRDLRVELPGGELAKINGAYQQGAGAMITTVQKFTGLPIHHYVEVNFVGFRNIVDALGGVQVQFEEPIREPDSGLNVPAGCINLEGNQALAFVRVRKIDDDFGRIARQQLFMSLMMDKVTSAGTLLNPVKMVRLVNLFSNNVTTDADLSINDIRSLAWRLRSFDPERVDMRLVPSASKRIGRISYVVHNEEQAASLFSALRERRPLPDFGRTGVSAINPADVRVSVLNGTTVAGLAGELSVELQERGFDVLEPANADRQDYEKTIVFHAPGFPDQATLVAQPYGAEVRVLPEGSQVASEIVVVVGGDYSADPQPPPPPTEPSEDEPSKPLIHRC